MEVTRYDAGRLGKVERNGAGGIRVPGNIGRTGIQIYQNSDGSIRREYRPPEAVFAADSLKSLGSVPVTKLHPEGGRVDTKNWRKLAIGHVADTAERVNGAAGEFVSSSLLINDEDVINEIESGSIAEISAGYTAHVDMTPGIAPNGEAYDAIQSNVRYNHVAVGPPGWARAGREARLRIDGGEMPPTQTEKIEVIKIVIDGVEYEVGSASHISVLQKQSDAAKAETVKVRADGDAAVAKLKADSDAALAKATARADKAEADLKALKDLHTDATFETRMTAELNFRADAVKWLGKDFAFVGKSKRDVQIAILKKLDPKVEIKADKSDEYVSIYFQGRTDGAQPHDYNAPTGEDVKSVTDGAAGETEAEYLKRLDAAHSPAAGAKK